MGVSSLKALITNRRNVLGLLLSALSLAGIPGRAARAQALQTDLNLVIAIDCSYSVNSQEFHLQVGGIVSALISDEIASAIKSGNFGQIGITIFQWSGPNIQEIVVPWTVIATAADARQVADILISTPRRTAQGVTAMGSAIDYGSNLLDRAPFWSERQVIDMQADGTSTWSRGTSIQQARNNAVARGIVINGLPILNEVPYLHHYFENHVIGGPGSFIEIAKNYRAFEKAIKRKLLREIRGLNIS